MVVIPVLDLLGGVVVHGVAGKRESYRPIESRLTNSATPLDIARAFRDRLGLSELYVADLDAILSRQPALETYRLLADDGFELWIDAGVRDADDADNVMQAGAARIVAGLETLAGPHVLDELCRRHGAERVVFSLDLKNGQPLGDAAAWGTSDPMKLATRAVAAGATRIIVLDLARVGTEGGVGTTELASLIRAAHPAMKVITGGGVRNADDLRTLATAGIDGVLLATALHREALTRSDLESL